MTIWISPSWCWLSRLLANCIWTNRDRINCYVWACSSLPTMPIHSYRSVISELVDFWYNNKLNTYYSNNNYDINSVFSNSDPPFVSLLCCLNMIYFSLYRGLHVDNFMFQVANQWKLFTGHMLYCLFDSRRA